MEIVEVTNPKYIGFDFSHAKGEDAFYLTVQLNTPDGVRRFNLNPYEVHSLLKLVKQIQAMLDADKESAIAFEKFKENYAVPSIEEKEYIMNIADRFRREYNED